MFCLACLDVGLLFCCLWLVLLFWASFDLLVVDIARLIGGVGLVFGFGFGYFVACGFWFVVG